MPYASGCAGCGATPRRGRRRCAACLTIAAEKEAQRRQMRRDYAESEEVAR